MPHEHLPFSPAAVAGDTCYLSGTIAMDAASGRASEAAAGEQTKAAVANLVAAAESAGFTASELVYIQVLLTDIADYDEVNEAYRQALDGPPFPARMTYAVAALPFGAKVEIQGIAARR